MDTRKIKKLIELVKETGIGELEVKSGEDSVRISCQTAQAVTTNIQPAQAVSLPAATAAVPAATETTSSVVEPSNAVDTGYKLPSPMVGTIYLAPSPGAKPFFAVGDRIEVGDTLCLIEAMKMFNKIESDVSGVLSARMVENEQPVEYDQTLFIIDTDE